MNSSPNRNNTLEANSEQTAVHQTKALNAAMWYADIVYGKGILHPGEKELIVTNLLPKNERPLNILDIGCGSGRLMAHVSGLGHRVMGVEISETSCVDARARGLDVVYGSADDIASLELPKSSFDVIVYLDVLEHLFNPAATIEQATKYLKSGGIFIVCVPNIACLPGRLSLMLGRWPLNQAGLFDAGHLRWFTKSNLTHHFTGVADIVSGSLRYLPILPWEKGLLWRLARVQSFALGILARAWPSLFAYEFIFKLKPIEDS
jgi:2-polyprenyl-3-methyl-5-hydroxy-6-metoxy-1,4-benzoquinol methylase